MSSILKSDIEFDLRGRIDWRTLSLICIQAEATNLPYEIGVFGDFDTYASMGKSVPIRCRNRDLFCRASSRFFIRCSYLL